MHQRNRLTCLRDTWQTYPPSGAVGRRIQSYNYSMYLRLAIEPAWFCVRTKCSAQNVPHAPRTFIFYSPVRSSASDFLMALSCISKRFRICSVVGQPFWICWGEVLMCLEKVLHLECAPYFCNCLVVFLCRKLSLPLISVYVSSNNSFTVTSIKY